MIKRLMPKRHPKNPNKNGGSKPNLLPITIHTIDPGIPSRDAINMILLSD